MPQAFAEEFQRNREMPREHSATLTVYRSKIDGRVIIGITSPDGGFKAMGMSDDDACTVVGALIGVLL